MKIERCVGKFYAVTSQNTEKINSENIIRCLKQLGIKLAGFQPKVKLPTGEQLYVWDRPKSESLIRLEFKCSEDPCLIILLVRILNNWGWDCIIMQDWVKESFLFARREVFTLKEINEVLEQ